MENLTQIVTGHGYFRCRTFVFRTYLYKVGEITVSTVGGNFDMLIVRSSCVVGGPDVTIGLSQ